MSDPSGELTIAFNGEIFNYVELRDDLRARGRRFRTSSDTEVILHLYEEMGADCLSLLNGDFAFAIWDARLRRMVLARDRMGVRPLFHTLKGGTLYFASEVKALLEVPGVSAEIDPDRARPDIHPVGPDRAAHTLPCIHELEPGHLMIADQNGITTRPYWQLDYPDPRRALCLRGGKPRCGRNCARS